VRNAGVVEDGPEGPVAETLVEGQGRGLRPEHHAAQSAPPGRAMDDQHQPPADPAPAPRAIDREASQPTDATRQQDEPHRTDHAAVDDGDPVHRGPIEFVPFQRFGHVLLADEDPRAHGKG
jgi:hypothetical protein